MRTLVQPRVDFHSHHSRHTRRDLSCQRTCARANFQDHIAGLQVGGLDEQMQQVQINEKVLPMPRRGTDAHLAKT